MSRESQMVANPAESPRGLDPAASADVRAHDDLVPVGTSWREAFLDQLKAKW